MDEYVGGISTNYMTNAMMLDRATTRCSARKPAGRGITTGAIT